MVIKRSVRILATAGYGSPSGAVHDNFVFDLGQRDAGCSSGDPSRETVHLAIVAALGYRPNRRANNDLRDVHQMGRQSRVALRSRRKPTRSKFRVVLADNKDDLLAGSETFVSWKLLSKLVEQSRRARIVVQSQSLDLADEGFPTAHTHSIILGLDYDFLVCDLAEQIADRNLLSCFPWPTSRIAGPACLNRLFLGGFPYSALITDLSSRHFRSFTGRAGKFLGEL